MPVVSCYIDSPRQTVDFPRFIVKGRRDNTCAAKLCFAFFSFFLAVLPFSLVKYSTIGQFLYKNAKNVYVLVCKIRLSLNIAYKGPDLRENLQSTITFADSKTENKPVKASTTIPPGPDCISCIFFPFANLAILIISLPLFFNRSLEEGKIGIMKFWDAGFNYTIRL